jgi:hypothetical protein
MQERISAPTLHLWSSADSVTALAKAFLTAVINSGYHLTHEVRDR